MTCQSFLSYTWRPFCRVYDLTSCSDEWVINCPYTDVPWPRHPRTPCEMWNCQPAPTTTQTATTRTPDVSDINWSVALGVGIFMLCLLVFLLGLTFYCCILKKRYKLMQEETVSLELGPIDSVSGSISTQMEGMSDSEEYLPQPMLYQFSNPLFNNPPNQGDTIIGFGNPDEQLGVGASGHATGFAGFGRQEHNGSHLGELKDPADALPRLRTEPELRRSFRSTKGKKPARYQH